MTSYKILLFELMQKLIQQNILYGLTKLDARFGTSMASLGDINHDTFNGKPREVNESN